ncbi:hypothetical protein [Streptomyces sp. NBC_00582]|uniref:hypothetical protein n=1 Tax=Streptomyces sp. NBC_00582 TaxID=2975783 RepID=UPI002E813ED7|nr:hypothetical protein [Streptomyces sp. NBC_00582]WUB63702.1 hypothetical protein OG852_26560 [Streptomyces sp. NBC_00582]
MIVAPDVRERDAPALAQRLVDRLVADGIVLADRGDHVLGARPPGPNRHRAAAADGDREPPADSPCTSAAASSPAAPTPPSTPSARTAAPTPPGHRRLGPRRRGRPGLERDRRRRPPLPALRHGHPDTRLDLGRRPVRLRPPRPEVLERPDLGEEFQARLTGLLDGHRTAYLRGRL